MTVHAECISPGFNPSGSFCNGCTYEGLMTMARDQTCERPYHPRNERQAIVQILSNRIVQRAKHGIAGANANTFAYAPSKGYVGKEEFKVEVTYREGQEVRKFFVHWNVVVQ